MAAQPMKLVLFAASLPISRGGDDILNGVCVVLVFLISSSSSCCFFSYNLLYYVATWCRSFSSQHNKPTTTQHSTPCAHYYNDDLYAGMVIHSTRLLVAHTFRNTVLGQESLLSVAAAYHRNEDSHLYPLNKSYCSICLWSWRRWVKRL